MTAAQKFMADCKALRESRGGRPTASLDADGQIVFTYPDGTVTKGGTVIPTYPVRRADGRVVRVTVPPSDNV